MRFGVKSLAPNVVSPSTWRSCGRPWLFELAYVRIAAYPSRKGSGVAFSAKKAPTWLASSSGAFAALEQVIGWPPGVLSAGSQRKPLVENQSIKNETRNVPGAPEPAYDVRRRPVEPQRFVCSMSERSRSSSLSSPLVGAVAVASAETPSPPKLAWPPKLMPG